jgi:hypothetical protein
MARCASGGIIIRPESMPRTEIAYKPTYQYLYDPTATDNFRVADDREGIGSTTQSFGRVSGSTGSCQKPSFVD